MQQISKRSNSLFGKRYDRSLDGVQNSVTVLIGIKDISNTIPVLVGQFNATVVGIPWIVVTVFKIVDWVVDITIGVAIRSVYAIIDAIAVSIGAGQHQATFGRVINPIVVAIGIQEVKGSVAVSVFRSIKRTAMLNRWIVESINHTITISIRSNRRRLVANCWLSFDRIGDTVVVAVEISEISNAITISVNGRCAELIPGSVSIDIGKSSVHRFLVINNTTTVSISINRKLITTFKQIADAVVVTVDVAAVVDSIAIGVGKDDGDKRKSFVEDAASMEWCNF